MMIDHVPQGNPCAMCGEPAFRHRPEHKPQGDPCKQCGMAAARHRVRKRVKEEEDAVYLGIDGEGQGRVVHKYVLLAASTETGDRAWWVENHEGLSTYECLDFILNLPIANTKVFAYSFNYDLTKILQDIDDERLYMLFRPELRARKGKDAVKGPSAIYWRGFKLNLQGTKFTIARGDRHRVIWDIWKFFQSKFVGALKDWKVGSKEMLARMTLMKDKRSEFDKESPEAVRSYCLEECRYMAELARKLVDAHTSAGLTLKSFYGAGSSAAAMLDVMGIKDKIVRAPKEMAIPVASGFFGGRFENSVIGKIDQMVYSYDISSAYPYQLCFLPCLLHGTWEHTKDRKAIQGSDIRAALVRYKLGANPGINDWGPFPFRTEDGSICYPITSGGGWVWRDEYLAGERLFSHVGFEEAWIYHCDCDCKPFSQIPHYYCERCRIGKEGPGIVIKLGCNSCYGKLAQSVGRGVYNSWIWAGIITSGCRAQMLDLLGIHKDRSNLLMVATDGAYTLEKLDCPKPKETGTDHDIIELGSGKVIRKPLGGWESDDVPKGVFVARPGIYFPLNPTAEEIKKVRGRGVGKGVVLENSDRIIESWEKFGLEESAKIANVSRFCGAKSSISRSGKPGDWKYRRAFGEDGPESPSYGQWVTRRVEMGFHPMPKREGVNPDGRTLALRSLPNDVMSQPYMKAIRSGDTAVLEAAARELLEQPDADLSDYELDDGMS